MEKPDEPLPDAEYRLYRKRVPEKKEMVVNNKSRLVNTMNVKRACPTAAA
jgi:hypothetical protein